MRGCQSPGRRLLPLAGGGHLSALRSFALLRTVDKEGRVTKKPGKRPGNICFNSVSYQDSAPYQSSTSFFT